MLTTPVAHAQRKSISQAQVIDVQKTAFLILTLARYAEANKTPT